MIPNDLTIKETPIYKIVASEHYNTIFDKRNGMFRRWGKVVKDDPQRAPINEILDIEITDICEGIGDAGPCPFCYKSNTAANKKNMSFDTFKTIIDKMKHYNIINQIAFGADAKATSNPQLFNMMDYSRSIGIIPNITVADISDETADKLSKVCGAVAVSRYANKNFCYDSIKKLVDRGMKQVNMHLMVHSGNLKMVEETLNDYHTDPRLKGMNAIVFLSLKQKGRGQGFSPMSKKDFKHLVDIALEKNIPIGFDSCGCHRFLEAVADHPKRAQFEQMAEPCESSLFSFYINVDGKATPCSFCDNTKNWEDGGIDVVSCEDFLEVWNHPRVAEFRSKLIKNGRKCPIYNVGD